MKRLIQVTSLLLVCLAARAAISAQQPTPAPTPAPTPPPRDNLRFIRMKISAGDLPSAESILEVHRADKGEDGEYILGLAWLARGAALVGRLDGGDALREGRARDRRVEARNAAELGAQLGRAVRAGNRHRGRGPGPRARGEERGSDPLSRAELEGARDRAVRTCGPGSGNDATRSTSSARRPRPSAPKPSSGPEFESLDALRGKPVVVYLWWEACGDCKAQSAAFRRIVEKYAPQGVAFVAPTRFYDEDHSAEKARIEKSWKETYGLADSVAAPISDEAMLRYGASATPTFAFVDRKGVVRQYLPYRMSEERLASEIEALLKSPS